MFLECGRGSPNPLGAITVLKEGRNLILQQLGAIAPRKDRTNQGVKSFICNAFEMSHGKMMSLVLTFRRQVAWPSDLLRITVPLVNPIVDVLI